MKQEMYDVAVIGAGIVGLSIARRLSRYCLHICILEKEPDVAMGATKANSAIVHGGYAESSDKLKGKLCYKGRVQYAKLDSELHFGFKETGSLVFTTQPEDLPRLEALLSNGRRNGLSDLEILNKDQALKLEPNLNPDVLYALHCKGAGICSPYEMAIALAENAVSNGAELFLNEPVTAISKQEEVFTITTSKRQVKAKFVVNCAGLSSAEVSSMAAPTEFEIKPRTGEYILLSRGSGKVLNNVVFQMPTPMGKGILVTPTVHGNLLLGPDAIDEPGTDNRSTHADRLAEIYFHALHTTGKINLNQFIRSFAGVRAVATGDDFIIDESKTKGFIQAAGIQSPGLTASPAIADRIADILSNAGLNLEPREDYDPNRKPIIETDKKMRPLSEVEQLITLPSGQERIVCRCEQVTEGTILDSLRRGIPVHTVDAVKRRTRASMGFCQGEFCRPRFMALMEREYGEHISAKTDVELCGATRVTKQELLDYVEDFKKELMSYMNSR
jgi:glycerol-3-phosphate dehydrogenase